MFGFIWNEVLYRPLFNVLIWLYNNVTDHNLGWAVVLLTIGLRIILLPLNMISEYNRVKNEELGLEIDKMGNDFKFDPVLRKQHVRALIKTRKVRPWAKTLGLAFQLLVLVLLYQVFWRGITGEKLIKYLYHWVDFPGTINVMFYGFNLGKVHDIVWAGIVGLLMLVEVYIEVRRNKKAPTKSDLLYFILFPLATFYLLWILPMVKSLFVLTSIVFSAIVNPLLHSAMKPKKKADHDTHH
ncbi:MAG TPA: YidC/Oxa1 family membrane protein insertase [Candidatus Magasanikbacteria bacterium]|nr:YidC/Oxa1 family membrane protein insertase [Candidatus Magasanikbacteria bacterium]